MANTLFDTPPALTGDLQTQTDLLYRYLMQMSEQLNEAMNGLTLANFAPEEQKTLQASTAGENIKADIDGTRTALRSLIIKTADIVRSEMQEISAELTSRYEGISEQFGQLNESVTTRFSATAEGISQNTTMIQTIQEANSKLEAITRTFSERIFSGIIGYNSVTGLPIMGIAIGENVTQYDANGNPYINANAKIATFTKDRLSFWQGTTEMAYFSNQKLYITKAEILNEMVMGNYVWKIYTDGSLGLMARNG